jgi:hypothetical protein
VQAACARFLPPAAAILNNKTLVLGELGLFSTHSLPGTSRRHVKPGACGYGGLTVLNSARPHLFFFQALLRPWQSAQSGFPTSSSHGAHGNVVPLFHDVGKIGE